MDRQYYVTFTKDWGLSSEDLKIKTLEQLLQEVFRTICIALSFDWLKIIFGDF